MCCTSFFLPSRLHHKTITYSRESITSNFLIKLVISQTAILCSACYFSKATDVPSARIIFILFHSSIHLSSSHTFKYCTLCVMTEFNKIHDDDDDENFIAASIKQTKLHRYTGMGSSRTVLDLEDSSRTKNHGLGLDLEDRWPWLWPLPQVSCPKSDDSSTAPQPRRQRSSLFASYSRRRTSTAVATSVGVTVRGAALKYLELA